MRTPSALAARLQRKQNVTWTLTLRKGVYRFSSDGDTKRKGSFRVT
jgi:hypothetical protein